MLALGLEAYEYHLSSAILKFHGPTVGGLVCSELGCQLNYGKSYVGLPSLILILESIHIKRQGIESSGFCFKTPRGPYDD